MKYEIREFTSGDIEDVMEIWLEANCQAHSFIPSSYWESNYEYVRQELPGAEILVCKAEHKTQGFIGIQYRIIILPDFLYGQKIRDGGSVQRF